MRNYHVRFRGRGRGQSHREPSPRPDGVWIRYRQSKRGVLNAAHCTFARRIVGWRVSRTALHASSSMPWSRLMAAASFIAAIAVPNTSRPSIRRVWPRRASSLPSEASAALTTTRSPKGSTVSTRPSSSIGVERGGISKRLNSPHLGMADWFNH